MSSTTTTQFYGLTQYIGTDKPDFADNNTAFRNVDADLHQVVQDSQGFTSDIADLTERVGNLDTDLTNLSGDLDGEKAKIVALQNKELSQDGEISRVERNAQDMITAYNEASATSTHAYAVGDYFIYNNVLYQATAAIAVGATIVPDTNCTTTNVTSELIQLNNDLDDLHPVELFTGSVSVNSQITLSDHVNNYRFIQVIINDLEGEGTLLLNSRYGDTSSRGIQLIDTVVAYNGEVSPAVMALADLALTNTDGIHYTCVRSAQANLTESGISYLSGSQTFNIGIFGCW